MVELLHQRLGFDDIRLDWVQDPENSEELSTVTSLERLTEEGLLDLGVAGEPGLGTQVAVISALARRSMSIAFSVWAHRMVVEYAAVAGNDPALLSALRRSEVLGSTAMASALRANLGLEKVGLTAAPVLGGYRVSGRIPWASNLFEGRTLVVAAAETPDGSHVVVGLFLNGHEVRAGSLPSLLALQATSSSSVLIEGSLVGRDRVLSEDLDGFLARVRPVFLLLQAALAIGLGEVALEAVEGPLHGADVVLQDDRARLVARHEELVDATTSALAEPGVGLRELLGYRLESSLFAQDAVALEARLAGGRGYVASSGTARRIREAAFLPIQSPTETQLRWELSCSA